MLVMNCDRTRPRGAIAFSMRLIAIAQILILEVWLFLMKAKPMLKVPKTSRLIELEVSGIDKAFLSSLKVRMELSISPLTYTVSSARAIPVKP
ncbi:MAG: hypothetical protein HC815_40710 [Richelia sp. RM1_1_1]|nr:hypothetical protein [Richelia sp. RM1_1_1]